MYKRILLKLSGEQLQGKHSSGFDIERASWIANELRPVIERGQEVVIMVGGGNYARGAQLQSSHVGRVAADNIGMLATLMNAIALEQSLNADGLPARALSNIKADQVVDQFTHRRAKSHLEKGRVVIVAGGVGRPYLTTDTAAVNLALEMSCDIVLKATKVNGVYDKDPAKHADAVKFDAISYEDALSNGDVGVMDKAALGLALEQRARILVFELLSAGNIDRAAAGESVGTYIG